MKWAAQKEKKDLERATKFQVALEDELHSNKQGLPFLRCHCLGYVMHPQFVLALFNFTRQLAVFWPKVCYACQQFVLALFNFTRQLAVFRPKVVFPRWGTYSNSRLFVKFYWWDLRHYRLYLDILLIHLEAHQQHLWLKLDKDANICSKPNFCREEEQSPCQESSWIVSSGIDGVLGSDAAWSQDKAYSRKCSQKYRDNLNKLKT